MPTKTIIESEKQKLFEKLLTEEATDTTLQRLLQINDILNFDIMYNSILNMLLGLQACVDWQIGLRDLDIFNIDFDFELPDIDELLQGINVKVTIPDLEDIFSDFMIEEFNIEFPEGELLDYNNTLKYFFKINMFGGLYQPYLPIGVYGVNKYGHCIYYIDNYPPEQTYSMPTLTMNNALNRATSPASTTLSRTELYSLIGQTEIADYIIERREWIEQCMEQGIFLGANLLGYSKFAEKIKKYDIEGALIKIKTKLGEEIEYAIPNMDFLSWQFILGITPLGIGRFTAFDTTVFKNVASRFGYYRGLRQKFRFQSPFTPLVWRKSFEEMRSVHKHRSALKFGTHRYLINTIRNQIKRKLSRLGYDGFTINKYVNAVIDLIYQLRKGHRKSREWKTKLSKEDFKKLWLDKWIKLGLNKSMLLELYEVYIGCQKRVSML